MKLLNVVVSSFALCGLTLVGCAKSDSNGQSNSGAAQDNINQQNISAKCPIPSILSSTSSSRLSSLQEIKNALYGDYELNEVHVYHVGNTPDGKVNGAFYGTATRYN